MFDFFSSINSKATNKNLTVAIAMIRMMLSFVAIMEFEIKAVIMVNKINNPKLRLSVFFMI